MKLGFTLKKAKKTGLLAPGPTQGDANGSAVSRAFEAAPVKKDDDAGKVFVTDFDPTAVAASATEKKATLVIPLLKANEWKAPAALLDDEASVEKAAASEEAVETPEGAEKSEMTEDEAAAAQLLADVQAQQNGDGGAKKANVTLVIPMASGGKEAHEEEEDPLAEKRAKLYNLKGEKKDTTAVPILQQNAVPGMDELADVTEKFRHDVELRPDELDVHSSAYDSVPVEDFGAAMLRGMGWKGSMDEENPDADDPKPRQRLLGLGATAKPKVAGDNGKNDRRRTDNQARSNGLNRREDKDEKKSRPSPSSSKNTSEKDDRRQRSADREKPRSRSRGRESRKDRDHARRSEKDSDEQRRDRDDSHSREKGRDRDRERSRSRERGRDRDRERDRDRRDDREKRKRSRSRDRSSDRKKSSRR